MSKLLVILGLLGVSAFSQITSIPDTGGGSGYSTGYNASVTSQTSLTVTAATHGQGTAPIAMCFDNSTPAVAVSCNYTRSGSGEVVFAWGSAFTGTVSIWAGGGTSGISGASSLTTAGAVPYVASAGVLTQAPTGLFYDSANVRLGVGTGTPAAPIDVVATAAAQRRIQITNASATGYSELRASSDTGDIRVGMAGSSISGQAGYINVFTSNALEIATNNTVRAKIGATTGNLLIGTTTDDGSNKLQVAGNGTFGSTAKASIGQTGSLGGLWLGAAVTAPSTSNYAVLRDASDNTILNAPTGGYVALRVNNANYVNLFGTGNVSIGNGTDGNYKLDIAASGSSGTLRVYDQTATTGSTLLAVQAGAGQLGNLVSVRNNAGSEIASITNGGTVYGVVVGTTDSLGALSGGLELASTGPIKFSSNTTFFGSKDLGLARNSAGVLEINNGTAGTLRDLTARYHMIGATDTVISRNTAAIAQIGSTGGSADGWLKLKGTWFTSITVSGLPTASAYPGMQMYVTDANATTIGSVVAGGGSNKVMVWSDGTNWKIYAN